MIDVMKIKEVHMIQIILCLVFYYSQIREVLWKRDDLKFEIGSAWNCSRVRMKFKPRQTPRGTEFITQGHRSLLRLSIKVLVII